MEKFDIGAFLNYSGIRPGAVYLLYGRPHVGKTAFGLSLISNSVREGGRRALIIYSRPRFPVERIAKVLTVGELSLINVCTPQSLEEQTNVISKLEFLNCGKMFVIVVDEITSLYSLSLSVRSFSTDSIREAAYEVNKQLGFLADFVRKRDALCLITCEEREASEFVIPLRRILFYWSEKVFRMFTDMRGRYLMQVVKPEDDLEFECEITDGLVTGIKPLR